MNLSTDMCQTYANTILADLARAQDRMLMGSLYSAGPIAMAQQTDTGEDEVDPDLVVDDDDDYNPSDAQLFLAQRSTPTMHISAQPSDPAPRLASAKHWITRILATPAMQGVEFPRDVRGYIYIDNAPHQLSRGSWVIDGSICYLGGASTQVDPLSRLAIITCVANITGALDDTAIVDLITNRLVTTISDSAKMVYHGFIRGTHTPTRLAIDQVNSRVAAEMNGRWFLTSGAPVEVDASWIVMDF